MMTSDDNWRQIAMTEARRAWQLAREGGDRGAVLDILNDIVRQLVSPDDNEGQAMTKADNLLPGVLDDRLLAVVPADRTVCVRGLVAELNERYAMTTNRIVVANKLGMLAKRGLVERVSRGFYRLAPPASPSDRPTDQ